MQDNKYRFVFGCNNLWQANRIKAGLMEKLQLPEIDDIWHERYGAWCDPAIEVFLDLSTLSKEHFDQLLDTLLKIKTEASRKATLGWWPIDWKGWDYVPRPKSTCSSWKH